MDINDLKNQLIQSPETVEFQNVIDVIETYYNYSPTRFINGTGENAVINDAGQNEGSCKLFAFAQLQSLDEAQTLACFGHYYREDVLKHPSNSDHANIRQFMQTGWAGIQFDQPALSPK